ncbi:hypothetical protein ACN47E_005942 [Coniothyrium glycines]
MPPSQDSTSRSPCFSGSQTNGSRHGKKLIEPRLFSTDRTPSLNDFKKLVAHSQAHRYPLASTIEQNVPVYDLPAFALLNTDERSAYQDEWYHILLSGPGVFVTKGLYKDMALIDRVNTVYSSIIAEEKRSSRTGGDHFATSGANDRIWNAFSKHCLADPASFFEYYSNPWLPTISAAWLGPQHRLTAQVNVVKPGANAQMPHRDYHFGFQDYASCAQFPRAVQVASQFLTLQGAVAHSEMPVESGPTRLLPFSQMFEEGYMAYRMPEFQDFFLGNYVSVPLEKGDGLFFNPALFHAAGQNDSPDILRSANLLQISSAFGKPMEMIDTLPLLDLTWDLLSQQYKRDGLTDTVNAFVGNVAEGYPFPTNLDRRVPDRAGMAPESEQALLLKGLGFGWDKSTLLKEVQKQRDESKA